MMKGWKKIQRTCADNPGILLVMLTLYDFIMGKTLI